MAEQAVAQLVMDANAVTTIMSNLNTLYSNAVSQLITYALGLVALVGVVIPLLVTLLQWRSLKAEKRSLELSIQDQIDTAKSAIRSGIDEELNSRVKALELSVLESIKEKTEKLEKKFGVAMAASMHLQGNAMLEKNQ